MLLNIQLFADETVASHDTADLEQAAAEFEQIANDVETGMNEVVALGNGLLNNEGLKSFAGNAIKSVFDFIAPHAGQFSSVLTDFGNLLTNVIQGYDLTDEQLAKEFEEWGSTITGAVSSVKSAFTETASGYTTGQYIMDLSSGTRNIVNETVGMIANTGKLISSAAGKSVLDIGKNIVQASVGTFKDLMSGISGGNGTGVRFWNSFSTKA